MELDEKNQNEKIKTGTVINCNFLNVRKFPIANAAVVEIINVGEKVIIDMTKFSNDFYKVKTASGTEGYCNKEFIKV